LETEADSESGYGVADEEVDFGGEVEVVGVAGSW